MIGTKIVSVSGFILQNKTTGDVFVGKGWRAPSKASPKIYKSIGNIKGAIKLNGHVLSAAIEREVVNMVELELGSQINEWLVYHTGAPTWMSHDFEGYAKKKLGERRFNEIYEEVFKKHFSILEVQSEYVVTGIKI